MLMKSQKSCLKTRVGVGEQIRNSAFQIVHFYSETCPFEFKFLFTSLHRFSRSAPEKREVCFDSSSKDTSESRGIFSVQSLSMASRAYN